MPSLIRAGCCRNTELLYRGVVQTTNYNKLAIRKCSFSKRVARRVQELFGALYSRPNNPAPSKCQFAKESGTCTRAARVLRKQHAQIEASFSRLQSFSLPLAHFLASGAQVLRQAEQASAARLASEGVRVHVVLHILHPSLELLEGLADPEADELLSEQTPDVRNRGFVEVDVAEAARQPLGTGASTAADADLDFTGFTPTSFARTFKTCTALRRFKLRTFPSATHGGG